MTRAMAAHHGKEGIRVNCVCPGMVFTPMVRGRGMTEEMRKARVGQNLMGQEGTAWDVGYAILFLCSKEARWITGLTMPVDAGVRTSLSPRFVRLLMRDRLRLASQIGLRSKKTRWPRQLQAFVTASFEA